MDPQFTLYNLLDAIHRNDRQDVDCCLAGLRNWNQAGGFLPTVDRPLGQHVAHYVVRNRVSENEAPPEGGMEGALNRDVLKQDVRKAQAKRVWHWAMEGGPRLVPGLRCLLPVGFMDDDWTGDPTCKVHILYWFKPSLAEDAQGQPLLPTEAIVNLVDDPCRETKVSCVALQRGHAAWLATRNKS